MRNDKTNDTVTPSVEDVRAAIGLLFKRGQVVELRGLGTTGGTNPKPFILSGFYDDHAALARDAVKVCEVGGIFGTYFTLQEISPALVSVSPNRYRKAGKGDCTPDEHVTAYRWLCVDLDPSRPAGISATDAEKAEAHGVMVRVTEFFKSLGVGSIQGDSGNGYHVLVRVELDVKDKALMGRVLAALDERFSTETVKLDVSVGNPSRIWKAYGTAARKGFPSEDRPHRLARLLEIPDTIPAPISRDLLETIAEEIPADLERKPGEKATKADIDWAVEKLEEFMNAANIKHSRAVEYKTGFKWLLDGCPFNAEHTAPSIIVTVADTGASGFRCLHNSCFGKKWADFRDHCETIIGHKFEFKKKDVALDPDAIVTNPGHLTEMVRLSEIVLHRYGLKYFERHGELVNTMFGRDVPKLKDVDRDGDSVVIQPASSAMILRDLDSKAKYIKVSGKKMIRVCVPSNLPEQIHDRVRSEPRAVPYPTLDMVSGSPVLLPSGTTHDSDTIFQEAVLFINAHTGVYPRISDFPTKEHALRALKQFEDIFKEFPFIDPGTRRLPLQTASYSVVLSGALSLCARPYLGIGACPVHGFTAHTPRSGKTKLVEGICMCAVGHRPTALHYSSETELDKHLQPVMQAGDRAVLADNIEKPFQSSKLCILVSGGVMRDRVLGESREVLLKNYSVFFATGNNLTFGGDLTARALRCDIDPAMERPESRAFAFDPVHLARERHPQLVTAALTMLRAYLGVGMPWNLKREPWGGFERWDKLVCGCLAWLGMADPYETRERIITDDIVRMQNLDLLEEWHLRYGERSVAFRDIQKDRGAVYEELLKDGAWDGHYAGWVLRRLLGKNVGGYRLFRADVRGQYRVLKSGGQTSFDDVGG